MESQGNATHRHVCVNVAMRLVSGPETNARVVAALDYTTRDPYAVRATFTRACHSPVVWVFARELLLVGVARHAGAGDVQVYPSGDDVILELNSPEGSARLAASSADLRRFGAQMLAVVAPGDESAFIDVDAELAALDPAVFARGDA